MTRAQRKQSQAAPESPRAATELCSPRTMRRFAPTAARRAQGEAARRRQETLPARQQQQQQHPHHRRQSSGGSWSPRSAHVRWAAPAPRTSPTASARSTTNRNSPRIHTPKGLAAYAFAGPATEGALSDSSDDEAGDAPPVAPGGVAEEQPLRYVRQQQRQRRHKLGSGPPMTLNKQPAPAPPTRRVVVLPRKGRKLFSSYAKFQRLAQRDAASGTRHISIRSDDTPFESDYDRRMRENKVIPAQPSIVVVLLLLSSGVLVAVSHIGVLVRGAGEQAAVGRWSLPPARGASQHLLAAEAQHHA